MRQRRHLDGGMTLLGALFLVVLLAGSASAADRGEADVLVAQAILAYDDGRYEDALATLRQALALVPDHAEALYYAGLVLIALDRLDEAAGELERARRQAPTDEAVLVRLGVTYVGLGRYDEARPLLEQVFARNPTLENLGYYVGFLRYQRGDFRGALRAFQAGVAVDPRLEQLTRFYRGLALQALGLADRAAAEIESAQRLLPASPLTEPAERLRGAVVATRDRERRFFADLRFGAFYDDNVPVVPEPSDDPEVQALRGQERASFGELAALLLDYTFLRRASLEAAVSYSLFATFNNALPDFNIVEHLGGIRGSYRDTVGALPYLLGLQYTYGYLTLGGDEFVQRHTVTPHATLAESPHHLTVVQLGYQRKDFADDVIVRPDDRRSGTNWTAGLTHIVRLAGDRHLLKVGYQWDFDDTDGQNYSYAGHGILAGGQFTFPWADLRLRYDFNVHFRDYRNLNSSQPILAPNTVERSDTQMTHIVGLALPLPRNLTLVAEYQATIADSNLDLFTFRRNVFSLVLTWVY